MDKLPEEIVTQIISKCCPKRWQWGDQKGQYEFEDVRIGRLPTDPIFMFSDLRNLCLVSKPFRRISQPVFYRTFHLGLPPGYPPVERRRLFLRSLLESAELASSVEEIILDSWETPLPMLAQDDLLACYDTSSNSFLSRIPGFHADLREGDHDAELVLLLALCPNLRALSFTSSTQRSKNTWLKTVLQQDWNTDSGNSIPKEERFLSNLEHLEFEYNVRDERFGTLEKLRSFFLLPKLKEIKAKNIEIHEGFMRGFGTSQLLHIRLYDCLWDAQGICNLLKACTHLETLELWSMDFLSVGWTFRRINVPALGAVLRQYGTSLKSLTVDARGAEWDGMGSWSTAILGSLKYLTQLQCIRVPLNNLISGIEEPFRGAERATPYGISVVHSRLRQDILPESVRHILIMDRENFEESGPDRCVVYKGTDGEKPMTMHFCRESYYLGSPVEGGCTVVH